MQLCKVSLLYAMYTTYPPWICVQQAHMSNNVSGIQGKGELCRYNLLLHKYFSQLLALI